MHSCDCFERHESRKTHPTDVASSFMCKNDGKKRISSTFSIDAILSKPGNVTEPEGLVKTSRDSQSECSLGPKPCFIDSRRPHSKHISSCCSNSFCHRPSRHLDYLAFYRYSRFVDEDASDLPRRCLDEPTMVHVSKHQGFPVGCAGCAECSFSIQRLGRGRYTSFKCYKLIFKRYDFYFYV